MNLAKYLQKAGVDAHLFGPAIASIERGMKLEKKTLKYRLLAPFVIAYLVWFKLKWEDDFLPIGFEKYDLEALDHIDINGDNKRWVAVEGEPYGRPVPVSIYKELPVDHENKELCYWAKGHHPRSRWARWIWMGIRNRAQRASYDLGDVYTPKVTTSWKYVAPDGNEVIEVYRNGDAWQIMRVKRVLKYLMLRQNVGFKVANIWSEGLAARPGHQIRMSTTAITFSLKGWKDKA